MARVLIIGGAGFIGARLARACLRRGDRVTILCRAQTSLWRLAELEREIEVERADLTAADRVAAALARHAPEEIYHLALKTRRPARDDFSDVTEGLHQDVFGMTNVVAAAARLKTPPRTFVRTGTIAEYGEIVPPFVETRREAPTGSYGASSLACTQFLTMMGPRLPFASATARLALTYGPDQNPDFLIPGLIAACLRRQPMTIRNPDYRRDLIHVDDVVDALLRMAARPDLQGTLLDIASGTAPSVREIAALVTDITGAGADVLRFAPQGRSAPHEIRASGDRARALLDWQPEIGLREGLERLIGHLTATDTSHRGAT